MLAPTPLLRPSPLDIGDLFAGSFAALKRRFGLFVLIALFPSLVGLVVIGGGVVIALSATVAAGSRGMTAGILVGIAVAIIGALATVLAQVKAQGMMSLGAYEIAQGQHPDLRGLLTRTRGFLPRMAPVIAIFLGAVLLAYGLVLGIVFAMVGALDGSSGGRAAGAAALMVLLVLAMIPVTIFLQIKLLYTVPAIALEQVGGIDGMKRSWRLTRGAFWRTFGYSIVASLAVAAVGMVVSGASQIVMMPAAMSVEGSTNDPGRVAAAMMVLLPLYLVVILLQVAVQLVTQPFLHAYTTYMFIDQVRRSELPPAPAYGHQAPQPGYYAPPGQYYGQQQPGQGYPPPAPPAPGQPGGWQPPAPPQG
ncbi:hypothetical protein PROP_03086 [Propionicimonas sp. T2.31MG-18]|uniref:glycerophosphoryl diester phosphodiesterase membrane domain-containing protein n=1 Tax=Propionicimonas sp. T2.31MG-18 TaxID=3157620 RepID=UPI0035E60C52